MGQMISVRSAIGAFVGLSLLAGLTVPASALPLPVNRDPGVSQQIETVQYRRRGPVRAYGRRGNGNAAAAAAVIGALAIGTAAIVANQSRRRGYEEYEYAPAAPPVYGYRPQPYGYAVPPSYGYVPPRPSRWSRSQPTIDGGSPYAVEQQRARNRAAARQYHAPQYYAPQQYRRSQPRYEDDHYGP